MCHLVMERMSDHFGDALQLDGEVRERGAVEVGLDRGRIRFAHVPLVFAAHLPPPIAARIAAGRKNRSKTGNYTVNRHFVSAFLAS